MVGEEKIKIGKKIREKRLLAGLTQSELADKIGRNISSVQKYEHGDVAIPINTLNNIAIALNVDLKTFISDEDTKHTPLEQLSQTSRLFNFFFFNVMDALGININKLTAEERDRATIDVLRFALFRFNALDNAVIEDLAKKRRELTAINANTRKSNPHIHISDYENDCIKEFFPEGESLGEGEQ